VNYPVWELATGGGLLIAVVSILHVFISHFAVGGGLWLVVTEMRSNRAGDERLRAFVRAHSRFFVLLTLVLGAISGVGIWFTIGLVSPQAVSALIHGYVWGWAIEWTFFFVEIAAALIYYYGWDRLDRATHELVGWVYFGAAFLSLVVINGIITFMLTPGGWLANGAFWSGFFNPTYWPSLALRTAAGVALAGFFTLLTATRLPRDDFRARTVRHCGIWALVGTAGVASAALWYGSSVPDWSEKLTGAIPILPRVLDFFRWGLAATLVLALWPVAAPRSWRAAPAALLALAALFTMGSGEWTREAARKPFTIRGYLYSNGMVADVSGAIAPQSPLAALVASHGGSSRESVLATDGVAAHTRWIDPAAGDDPTELGRDLFRAHCRVCHTRDGYNGLGPALGLWNEETVASLVPRLQYLRALMPPWYGTEVENAALVRYLMSPALREPLSLPAERRHAEQRSFAVSCGLCHTADGYRPLRGFFTNWGADEIDAFLDEAGEYFDAMPGYYGPPEQRELLVAYLERLGAGGAGKAADPTATAAASGAATTVAAGNERSAP
jgi:mono/diheme cytochrome c family protein